MRRPSTPWRNGPKDLATLEGFAQASVTLPLPLEGPRGQAATPLVPGACLVQPSVQARTLCGGAWRSPADYFWSPSYHTGASDGRENGAETPPAALCWLPPVVAIPTVGSAALWHGHGRQRGHRPSVAPPAPPAAPRGRRSPRPARAMDRAATNGAA
jgi:hypothetical protein